VGDGLQLDQEMALQMFCLDAINAYPSVGSLVDVFELHLLVFG